MCCIFTCCGWMLDLIQRCWIFFMSCCISSAVCCVLLTASTSGIALGYNYSLAEYIDLKETNISVYIKRGVFDDDIADDMDWRRSGGGKRTDLPEPDQQNYDLRRSEPKQDNGDTTIRSGRRLDDSLYEADNQNKYEGSLMKLTAKGPFHPSPPYIPPTDPPTEINIRQEPRVEDLVSESPPGSLDRLKAIQAVINARRAGQRNPEQLDARRNLGPDNREREYKFLEQYPGFPVSDGPYRRAGVYGLDVEPSKSHMPSNPHRDAVPPQALNRLPVGLVPVVENSKINALFENEEDYETGRIVTFPKRPPTVQPSPIRPSPRPVPTKMRIVVADRHPMTRTGQTRGTPKDSIAFKDDLDKYKQRLLINQYDSPGFKADDFDRKRPDQSEGDDYEEGFKGRPVRRKRAAENIPEEQSPNDVIWNIVSNASSLVLTNDANIDVVKPTTDVSVNSNHIYSTHLIKIKRKNARGEPRKRNRKQKGNKNKNNGRRKKRPTSKMRKSVKGKRKKRREGKKSVTSNKNIDKVTDGMSYFISKLTPVTAANPMDGKLRDQKNKTETTVQETPFTVSLDQLLFL